MRRSSLPGKPVAWGIAGVLVAAVLIVWSMGALLDGVAQQPGDSGARDEQHVAGLAEELGDAEGRGRTAVAEPPRIQRDHLEPAALGRDDEPMHLLVDAPPDLVVGGSVRSATGTGLAGARVEARWSREAAAPRAKPVSARSDEEGRFELRLSRSEHDVRDGSSDLELSVAGAGDGHVPLHARGAVPRGVDALELGVELLEAGYVHGVVESDQGEPLSGARVLLLSVDREAICLLQAVLEEQSSFLVQIA